MKSLAMFMIGMAAITTALAGGPASGPSVESSRPAASRAAGSAPAVLTSGDAAVDAILDRLEVKGKAISDLRAKLVRKQIDTFPVAETRSSEGVLLFRKFDDNPKFLIRFDKRTAAGIVQEGPENREWFLFDGEWMTERQDKTKTIHKRQILRPGEHLDVFKLNEGRFPIPIGQSRKDMLTHFVIKREAPKPDDPANCDHLVCTVQENSRLAQEYKKVDFFVDRKLDLPVLIRADRAQDDTQVEVSLSGVELNVGLAASEFVIEMPADYQKFTEPLPAGNLPQIVP